MTLRKLIRFTLWFYVFTLFVVWCGYTFGHRHVSETDFRVVLSALGMLIGYVLLEGKF